jgi:hypothetical protein
MTLSYRTIPLVAVIALAAAGCAQAAAPTPQPITPAAVVVSDPAPAKTVYVQAQPPTVVIQQAPRVVTIPAPAPVTIVQAPRQAGPGVGNSYPINSQGSLINVRVNPSKTSGLIGQVAQDDYVTVDCTQYGESVTGPWGTTTLWDHISAPYSGYVSDMWVNTASGKPVVGSC